MFLISKIHLNWGIKTFIKKYIKRAKDLIENTKLKLKEFRFSLETYTFIHVFRPIEIYFSQRIGYYFGADYHWENNRSQNLDIKKGNLGYGFFLYSLLINIRPTNVLCFGSMYGFMPYMLAAACRDAGSGKVDFIDPGYDFSHPNHNYGQGFWKQVDVKKHFSYMNANKFIKYYQTTSFEFAKKTPKKNYDLMYFDGDHSYVGAKKDFDNFWPRLNTNGYLVFHDINIVKPDPLQKGMKFEFWKIIEEIKKRPDAQMIIIPSEVSGIGIIQKISNK